MSEFLASQHSPIWECYMCGAKFKSESSKDSHMTQCVAAETATKEWGPDCSIRSTDRRVQNPTSPPRWNEAPAPRMSYQIPQQKTPEDFHVHNNPQLAEPYPDNNEGIRQAREEITKLIDQQHAGLKVKFDQIRHSLSEKERRVHQDLDEILNSRLNQLDECARNINSLNETFKLNQQKLDTKTLGDVNFKILTALTESIESFRRKINLELSVRILWGSQNIEQSIKNICTISYVSDAANGNSPPAASPQKKLPSPSDSRCSFKCICCDAVFSSSDELSQHACGGKGIPDREQPLPPPIHVAKVFAPGQNVSPNPQLPPSASPANQIGIAAESNDNSEPKSLFFHCQPCKQYLYPLAERDNHMRKVHGATPSKFPERMSPAKPEMNPLPPHEVRAVEPGGQQQLCAAVSNFHPIKEQVSPPAPIQPQASSNRSAFSPLDQQQHAVPSFSNSHLQQHQQQQLVTPVPQHAYPAAVPVQYQEQNYIPQPHFSPPLQPQPTATLYQSHRFGMESIRRYRVRLIWRKAVQTLSSHVVYFDNFDGCLELVWNKRHTLYMTEAELEEGEHYGQLSMSDSEVIYTVEKFVVQMSSQQEIQLQVIPMY